MRRLRSPPLRCRRRAGPGRHRADRLRQRRPRRPDSGTLDVWVYGDASATVQREVVKRFNKDSEVKAKLTEVPGTATRTRCAPRWAPQRAGRLLQLGRRLHQRLRRAGHAGRPRSDAGEGPGSEEGVPPTILDAGAVNGKHYGIPMRGMQPVILFYNKDVFAEAGAKPPTSWQDLLDLVDTFKAKGVAPFALAGTDAWPEQMWLEYLVDRYGGAGVFQNIQRQGSEGWGDPAVLKAARTVKDLVDRGAFGKNYRSVNYTADGAQTLFAKGRAAMHLMGSFEYANQQSLQPKFAKSGLGWTTFRPCPAAPATQGRRRQPDQLLVGEREDEGEGRRDRVPEVRGPPGLRQGPGRQRRRAHHLRRRVAAGRARQPRVREVPVRPGQERPAFTLSWDQALPGKHMPHLYANIQKLFNGQLSPEDFVAAMKGMG
ncbi:extracellular solute-binding protein [Streptomyces sp. M19]